MIYVVEIPHRKPAMAWSKNTEEEVISAIQAFADRQGVELDDDLEAAVDWLGEDLSAVYCFTSDEEAVAAFKDDFYWNRHQGFQAHEALGEELRVCGVFVD